MKQIIQSYRNGKIELSEVPFPSCPASMILVRNTHSVISIGTERSMIELGRKSLLGKAKSRPDLVKRFIENGVSGFIVPPSEPNALAKKIRVLIEDPILREKLGKKAREVAIKNLDLNVTVKKHIEIYRECLKLDIERKY